MAEDVDITEAGGVVKEHSGISHRLAFSGLIIILLAANYYEYLNLPFAGIDGRTAEYLASVRNQALGAWALASILNGLISALQGTEVGLLIGLGLVLKPGELLDPVNDLVEVLAMLMLKAIGITAVQEFLAEISSWLSFRFFLTASLLLFLFALWLPRSKMNFRFIASRLLLITIVLRFAFPASAYVGMAISDRFLDKKYQESMSEIEKIQERLEEVKPPEINGKEGKDSQKESWWQRLKEAFASGKNFTDITRSFMALMTFATNVMVYFATLIAVFAIKTLVLPIGVFLFIYRSTGYLLRKVLP